MNLTSVIVDGVGKFGARTEITGLGPGVNILAAGNEAGKSTLFRAVRACLFERHNTRNEIVRGLATEGLSLPVTVTLGFEHEGQAYTVTKAFMKSPTASLLRGATEIARGREADERIWELLGIAPGSGRSVDDAAFGILWVGQGESFRVPEPSQAATTALNSAIQAEVGTLVGGERARSVLAALRTDLALFVTDTGRAKAGGPLALATSRLETIDAELLDTERRLATLNTQLAELATKRNESMRLADPSVMAKSAADLSAAQRDLKVGEAAIAQLAQFESAEQVGKIALDRTGQRIADLEERRVRIDGDRRRSVEISEALTPIEGQTQTAQMEIQRLRDEIGALVRAAETDDEEDQSLRRLADCISRSAGRASLVHQQHALEELATRLVTSAAALGANRATATVIVSLDKAERELAVLIARLEASAPQVSVELKEGGAGKVSVGAVPIGGSVVRSAIDPLTIEVGDLARIIVSSPANANAADLKKRMQLQAQLSALVQNAGAANADELRAAGARRQGLEAEAAGLRAEMSAFRIEGSSPAPAIERIKAEIEEIDALVTAELTRAQLEAMPTAEDVARRQEDVKQEREQARRRRQALDGAIEAQNAILADLAGTRGRLGGTRSEVMKSLQADLAVLPDADRAQLIEAAEKAAAAARDDYGIKAAALEQQRQRAPRPEELERLGNRIDRLLSSLDMQKSRLGNLDRDIANLEGQIQNAGGDGLGERAENLREERHLAERDLGRHNERVATLTLLKETIETCYEEQRDRLHAPLRRHLRPFLNDLFPAAELELGDGFSIAGIRRDGPAREDFGRLSAGTQEQIAVLVRLAMGAMICERGEPVPIILDDALVFSDDDRIEQMFDALNRAGQRQQVIVLTCRTRAFAALGGRQLTIASKGGDAAPV